MTNKKTKSVLTTVVVGLLLILIFLFAKILNVGINSSEEIIHTHSIEQQAITLNDGKFYFNGNTDSVYYDIQNGNMQLVFDEETYKEYLRENNYNENEFDKKYDWALNFWEKPKPCKIWILYPQADPEELFVSFETLNMECDYCNGEDVSVPGGGWHYIDENNFGSVGGSHGDIIFTRVSE